MAAMTIKETEIAMRPSSMVFIEMWLHDWPWEYAVKILEEFSEPYRQAVRNTYG